jgi:spiro-SPASM protein
MPLARFKTLVSDMVQLSGEAVVSLSLWGEPLAHPDFIGFMEAVLAQPGLSVLVETDGSLVTEELSQKIRLVVDSAPPRTNGHPAIMWIVSLDSQNQQMYQVMRGAGSNNWPISHDQAQRAFQILGKDFPGASYVQFVRTKTNEEQLEDFYRSRKDCGGLIIQKYNNFLNSLPEQQVTDLSPVVRNPCWHQRRDMVILVDGRVPPCGEFLFTKECGNVFSQSLQEIWEKGRAMSFMDECEQCDEYYTFNF